MTINIKTTRYYWMKAYTHINGIKMTATDKVVYESLHAFASTTERVSPSVAYLSAINGIGATAIKDSLKRLEAALLITKQTNGNRANSYELNLAELMKLSEGYREMIQAAQEREAEAKERRFTAYKLGESVRVLQAKAKASAIDTVLRILSLMGVIHEDATPVAKAFTKAKQEPLDSVKKESTGASMNYNVEPVIEHPVKPGDMLQEEYDVCEWTGEKIPKNKREDQSKNIDW